MLIDRSGAEGPNWWIAAIGKQGTSVAKCGCSSVRAVQSPARLAGRPPLEKTDRRSPPARLPSIRTMMLARWKVSSFCTAGSCVGVLRHGNSVLIADTKVTGRSGTSPTSTITLSIDQWQSFVRELLADVDKYRNGAIVVEKRSSGKIYYFNSGSASLEFTLDEIEAFVAGLRDGEFSLNELAFAVT